MFPDVKNKKIKKEYLRWNFEKHNYKNLYLVATIDKQPDTYTLSFFLTPTPLELN